MKTLGKILLALIGLLVLALLALVLLVDVNRFKPHIENLAKEQGIALAIKGDLGWNLWPSIGVEINELSVAALATPEQPLAELTRASLMLKLIPLFSGDFQVDHLLVDGARINLAVDKAGKGNWEDLINAGDNTTDAAAASATTPGQATDAASADQAALTLDIQDISLTNSQVSYRDAKTGQSLELRDINLHLNKVNTRAEPFPLSLTLAVEMEQAGAAPLLLNVALKNRLSVDNKISNITLNDGELQLGVGKSTPLLLTYQLALSDVQNKPAYKGLLTLKETNLRTLLAALGTELETANNDALKQFSFSAAVDGNDQQVQLNNLAIQLDKTRFDGSLAVTDIATTALKLDLKGDSINVDDYLPPPSETETTAAAAAEDTPLPLETIRGLNVNAKFALQRMIIKQMALENIVLDVSAKNGVVNQKLNAKAYQGDIAFNSKTDARSAKAALTFDGAVKGFELAPLLKDLQMDEKFALSGAIQANTQGTAQGASVNQLMESMNSTASFSGAQVRLAPLNIEEQFCKLVNLVTQNSTEVSWDAYTEMRQLDGNIIWRDQVISLNSFNAGVSQLLLASTGKINLASDKYEFKLPIKIASASDAARLKGCSLGTTTNYWVDRGLSLLRCKGSFGAIDPLKDCGFDKSALGDLTKDFAEYKLREKHGAKIEAAEQKVEEKKQEVKEQVEEKKQELINKLQNKLFKTPKSSAAASSTEAQ